MNLEELGPIHYRFSDTYDANGVEIICTEYVVLAETPKGYWVIQKDYRTYWEDWIKRNRKWVSKDSYRRFCYPDRDKAFTSYYIRKQHQVRKLEFQLEVAKAAHETAKALYKDGESIAKIGSYGRGVECGKPLLFNDYVWED